jgi:hypothetical protein
MQLPLEEVVVNAIIACVKRVSLIEDCPVEDDIDGTNVSDKNYLILLTGVCASLNMQIIGCHAPSDSILGK